LLTIKSSVIKIAPESVPQKTPPAKLNLTSV
jgi:hypothetical protein